MKVEHRVHDHTLAIGLLLMTGALSMLGCEGDAAESGKPGPRDERGRNEGPVEIPTKVMPGGQSGAEGGCARAAVDALAFDVEDALELVEGVHQTELSWRPWWSAEASGPLPLRVELTVQGEPRVKLDCGGHIELDVEVELTLPEAPPVRFSSMVDVSNANQGRLLVTLDSILAEHLELPAPVPANRAGDAFRLELWFYPGGLRGQLGSTGADAFLCSLAVWPADSACRRGEALDDARAAELGVATVISRVQHVEHLAIAWEEGGAQEVAIEIRAREESACSWPDTLSAGSNVPATTFAVPVDVRLTGDGLDLSLRGELTAQAAMPGELSPRIAFKIDRLARADTFGALTRDLDADTLVDLVLRGGITAADATGELLLFQVDPHASVPSFDGAIESPSELTCFGESHALGSATWAKAN